MDDKNILEMIREMYDRAVENYQVSRSDYDAGVCDGIKRILDEIRLDGLRGISDILGQPNNE